MTDQTYIDGVYFNMPEEDYHALTRLSASGLKDILVSIPTYWAKSAMNKNKVETKEPYHFALGNAYHAAVFEPETFKKDFAKIPHKNDYPEALATDTAVKAELKASGQPQTKTGENALDRAFRLRASGYDNEIFSIIESLASEKLGTRTGIKSFDWRQIKIDLGQIDDNPEIKNMLIGGASEVSILWTCPDTGIQMKCRIDKLKPDYFIDMKTFQNSMRKPVERCIKQVYEYEKHYIQARVYQTAISMIGQLNLSIVDLTTDQKFPEMAHSQLLEDIVSCETPHKCWYFWREKNGVPNILMREIKFQNFPSDYKRQGLGGGAGDEFGTIIALKADTDIKYAKLQYLQAMEVYGPDKTWYNPNMIMSWEDDGFSDYFLNAQPE